MSTLDQVLDHASKLTDEQQEMLIQLLQKRRSESRREEIAQDAQQSLEDFRAGKLVAKSAQEVILELRQFLEETDM
jgi:hypothetical protein